MKAIKIISLFIFLINTSAIAQHVQTAFSSEAFGESFSGKVLLYLSKDGENPKDLAYGLPLLHCYCIEVKDIAPNAPVVFDDSATSFPVKLSELERGQYYAQVVWDRNTGGRNIGSSPDNMYNTPIKIKLTKDFDETFLINCNSKIASPNQFEETEYVKVLKAPSALLSSFYNKETTINAAIILPEEYDKEPKRKFPVLYEVSGFGGDYHSFSGDNKASKGIGTIPCITIFLDGNCPTGHSTYANSDNNGPWGDALVNEFIPLVEQAFRCDGARLLTGHSSGGWTVAWLQVNYPKTFAGCWSSAPDPVDFRNFELVNLYDDKNMYYTSDGELRIDASIGGRNIPWGYLRDSYQLEHVLYRGEQYASWNAVFGKKADNGAPESVCDVSTGKINQEVVSHWENYDISLLLRNHWKELKSDLSGKIRFSVGTADNYYLDKSVMLLENEMKDLDANFVFAYYPGDHFTVHHDVYNKDGFQFLEAKYEEWLAKQSTN
ncbi:alpha/beta hydrolase-fold protein [Mangrovibacterium lignilyticum]|uniref:alpha/beta hydrolase-fold protein n=1 Tax=Mangrovibacterium lignilyticum TaxID=2668052 RepID=UPI0013D123EC|nr:alpha/beta hydrolase-fold protein [Mangrovibacterium lignilyticum]